MLGLNDNQLLTETVMLQSLLVIVVKMYPERVKHEIIPPMFLEGSECRCQQWLQQQDFIRSRGWRNNSSHHKNFLTSARFPTDTEVSVLVALMKIGGTAEERDALVPIWIPIKRKLTFLDTINEAEETHTEKTRLGCLWEPWKLLVLVVNLLCHLVPSEHD